MADQLYLIALGSNRRHHRHGAPRKVLGASLVALEDQGVTLLDVGPIVESAPIGPSLRRYANGAALVISALPPPDFLAMLKGMEAEFGRRSRGQRWSSRVLDLDVILWDGGPWQSPGLVIPHPAFRDRAFVLGPAMAIADRWRDPLSQLSIRQLHARLTRPRRLPRWAQPG